MFCPNCGAQNPDGAAVCVSCRQSLQQGGPAPVPGRPAARFKGTMLMTGVDQPGGIPGLPPDPFAHPAPAQAASPQTPAVDPSGGFPKTVAGGMAVFGSGAGTGSEEDMMESKTVLQPHENFGFSQGRTPPGLSPAAPPAPMAPVVPETTDRDIAPAHTVALDASAFGIGGGGPQAGAQTAPIGSPFGAPQRPPQAAPQGGPPQAAGPVGGPPSGSSTVALDASAFGMQYGGPGAPGAPGPGASPFGAPARPGSQGPTPSPFGAPQGAPNYGPPAGAPPQSGGPGLDPGSSKGVASTVAIDASQFNFGGGGYPAPGGPGGPQGAPGPQGMGGPGAPQGAWGQPPQGAWGQPQGPQGQPQYGTPFAPPQQPGIAPYGALQAAPASGGSSKGLWIVVGLLLFFLAASASVAVVFFFRR